MIEKLDHVPDCWKPLKNTNTQPIGYKWYYNGESRFGGKYRSVLVRNDGNERNNTRQRDSAKIERVVETQND